MAQPQTLSQNFKNESGRKIELDNIRASLIDIEEKFASASKENRILQLTLQEINEVEGDAKYYESHGRAYVRKDKREVIKNIESMLNAKSETIKVLKENREKKAAELQIKKN